MIGTVAGGANGANLVVSFNGNATPPAAQALAQDVIYSNATSSGTTTKTLTFTVVDGGGTANGGSDTGAANATINVTGPPSGVDFTLPSSFASIDSSGKLNGTLGTFAQTGGVSGDTFTYSGSAGGLSVSAAGVPSATNVTGSTSGTVIALAVTVNDTTNGTHTTVTYDVVVGTDGGDTINVSNTLPTIVYGLQISNNHTDTITASGSAPVWIVDGGNGLSGGGNGNSQAVITGGSGDDVIFAPGTATNDVGSTTVTGGGGTDTMTGNNSATPNTYVVNSAQSPVVVSGSGNAGSISGYDVINNFSTTRDVLNLQGTPAASTFSSTGSVDSTLMIGGATVKSHSITSGVITFDTSSETFSSAVSLNAADTSRVAAVIQYLENNDIGNAEPLPSSQRSTAQHIPMSMNRWARRRIARMTFLSIFRASPSQTCRQS